MAPIPVAKYDAAQAHWTRLFGPMNPGRFRKAVKPLFEMGTLLGEWCRAAVAYRAARLEDGRRTSVEWFVQDYQSWVTEANKSPCEEWAGFAAASGITDPVAFSARWRDRLHEQDLAIEARCLTPDAVAGPGGDAGGVPSAQRDDAGGTVARDGASPDAGESRAAAA